MLPKSSTEILAAAKRAPSKQAHAQVNHKGPRSPPTVDTIWPQAAFAVNSDIDGCSEDLLDEDSDLVPTCITWASDSEPESPITDLSRVSLSERISEVLAILRGRRLSPFDFILQILDEDKPQYSQHRTEFYKEGNQKLFKILNIILANNAGKRKLRTWIHQAAALDLVCDAVAEDMTRVQNADLLPGIAAITPEFIKTWTISSRQELAPYLTSILVAAAQTTIAKDKNKKKKPEMLCNIILNQLSYQRSNRSLGFPTILGLFLWATGSARQTIDALHNCGLSISYSTVLNSISHLANKCVELAIKVGSGIHVFCYDNVNLSTSIFVEQRGASTPGKVTSGTFPVLYKVRNGNPEHMKIAPIMQRFKQAKGLKFILDIQPAVAQLHFIHFQLKVAIVRVLIKYVKGFESYAKDPSLQHTPRRPMPKGYVTEQFPLRATTIEEATIRGNLLFHDDVYVTQLKRPADQLSEYAIPSINDQLTNARIRSGQILRAQDVDAWERREVFQLGFGLFHLCLNLVWALLHVHRGSLGDTGSLTYFFALLEKTRLGNEHPDYHTLLAALTQIFDGLILNAWRTKCVGKQLSHFAASQPSSAELLEIAGKIILQHATPMETVSKEKQSMGDSADEEERVPQVSSTRRQKPLVPPIVPLDISPDPDKDKAHQNLRLLTRDLLYLAELICAISDGDIGRIEDLFPQLVMMFRGAGSNNYCTEILHFILNLKYVWTPEFANIMRDNMLVNLTGLEGHAMPIDINMEHLIGQLKVFLKSPKRVEMLPSMQDLLSAKGFDSTWDQLGDISASIDYLNKIKTKVRSALKTSYQGSTHTPPDTTHLVWRVADKVRDEELQVFLADRAGNAKVKSTLDILATGEAKLKTSTLATFNRKVCAMVNGHFYEEEEDTLPPPQLSLVSTNNVEE